MGELDEVKAAQVLDGVGVPVDPAQAIMGEAGG